MNAAKQGLKSSDPVMRKKAQVAVETINRELSSSYLSSARESLLREKRQGNKGNVLEIQNDDSLRKQRTSGGKFYSGWRPGE